MLSAVTAQQPNSDCGFKSRASNTMHIYNCHYKVYSHSNIYRGDTLLRYMVEKTFNHTNCLSCLTIFMMSQCCCHSIPILHKFSSTPQCPLCILPSSSHSRPDCYLPCSAIFHNSVLCEILPYFPMHAIFWMVNLLLAVKFLQAYNIASSIPRQMLEIIV